MTIMDGYPLLEAKKAAAHQAAHLIQDGMVVGLGTGSTAALFIDALGKRIQEGLKITALATSQDSTKQAEHLGIPLMDSDSMTTLDITVDGADEIDPSKNMIKGGGGALLREKLLARSAKEMIVIVDETKLVDHLGAHPLPVEISSYVYKSTIKRLHDNGFQGTLRLNRENTPFITDNGNFIFDIQNPNPILDPPQLEKKLKAIVGVLETGLFYQIAGRVIIGYEDGLVEIKNKDLS